MTAEKPKSPVRQRMKRTGETYEVAFAAVRREQIARAGEAAPPSTDSAAPSSVKA